MNIPLFLKHLISFTASTLENQCTKFEESKFIQPREWALWTLSFEKEICDVGVSGQPPFNTLMKFKRP